MRVTLIRPSFGYARGKGYDSAARMEPLALGILAALTPRWMQVTAVDERVEPVAFDAPTDLVALSVCTFSAKRAYEIAARYRARGVPVVMGGFHPTLMPDEAAEHADVVAIGDAEGAWPDILTDFARGTLKPRYGSVRADGVPPISPDRRVFKGKGYLPIRLVQFSRGCHRNCEFCSIRAFYGGGHVCRPVEQVVDEIRALRASRIFLVDDNAASDVAQLRRLLEAMIPLRVRWSSHDRAT
ncbi:MAG: cobalamin-dependent protein [Polyangiaceae bacterium]|nr:cobalamin-dependent protein [Polyangiaceae bacterium]